MELLVFYGEGVIRDGPFGLDLTGCQCKKARIQGLETLPFEDLRRFVRKEFDRETASRKLVIEAVLCKNMEGSSNLFWELHKVVGSIAWAGYMRLVGIPSGAIYRLPMVYVQFIEVPRSNIAESSGSRAVELHGIPYQGVAQACVPANEGNIALILDQIVANEYAERYRSSHIDRDDEHVPGTSDQSEDDDGESDGSKDIGDESGEVPPPRATFCATEVSSMSPFTDVTTLQSRVIHDECRSNLGYDGNNPMVGQRYPSKHATWMAITRCHLSMRRQFKAKRSNSDTYKVLCIHSGCPARVRAQRRQGSGDFEITLCIPHTCEISEPLQHHRNVTSAYVAEAIYHLVSANISLGPKVLMAHVADAIGYAVSYNKVRRAKQKVIEMMFGTYKEGYNFVPRILQQIQISNPGTCIKKLDRPHPDGPRNRAMLDRVFWAFRQTIQAFKYCRPVLLVDGIFLTGKYKGTMLVAMAADANDQVLPVAYAIVESENTSSWLWFLVNLKLSVVGDRPNICLISSCHAGLLHAINTLKNAPQGRYQWSDLHSRWCMRYMAANLFTRFKSKELSEKFKRMCVQNQERKFKALWEELDAITARQEGLQGGTSRRDTKFSDWVNQHAPELEKWSLLHDTDGCRYGIMTTNMLECYNGVLKGAQCLPLTAIVDETWIRTVGYFINRAVLAKRNLDEGKQWSEKMRRTMNKKIEKSWAHDIRVMDLIRRKYEIRTRQKYVDGAARGDKKHVVKLEGITCSCTCNKPTLLHYPCSHVYKVCAYINQSSQQYVSEYFNIGHLMGTWNSKFSSYGIDMSYKDLWPGVEWTPNNEAIKNDKKRKPPHTTF